MTDPQPVATPVRRVRWGRVVVLVLALSSLLLGGIGGYAAWAMGGSADGERVVVVVPEGATGGEIGSLLAERDVVRSSFMFRLIARLRGAGGDLKPGAYTLRADMGVNGALDELIRGVPAEVERFTIPEGETVIEIARIVGRRTHISEQAFLRAARSGRFRTPIMPSGQDNLEGMLFPDTYEIALDATAADVIRLMLRRFESQVGELDLGAARAQGVTPYEAVIIASMIEREARVPRERRLISSVMYNRLARPQRLEIDATVQYVILHRDGRYKDPLTFADYEIDSPYNTYRIDGLPPTPIASPGLASMRAALDPATTDYYYYRLKNERGEHCFNQTFEQHDRGC